MSPRTLANSSPSLFINIDVGTPLREKVLAKVTSGSKKGSKFFKFNFTKNSSTLFSFSFPILIGKTFKLLSDKFACILSNEGISSLHLELDIGKMAEIEIITRINGNCEWFGLLRTLKIQNGANVNDVVVNLQNGGSLLRFESVDIGRDAQISAGTVSSGSEKTKADLRYFLGEPGSNLKSLGSILSVEKMHLDHHIEILHESPETQSRLSWHSACSGSSKTIGTGMLRVKDGAIGADAAQIFHNLLLSRDAEADSIPELEVMEHDVVGCGHGTANGPIDEDQKFYLESRGFNPSESKAALIAAFLNTTLSQMGSEKTHQWLVGLLSDELELLV